MNLAALFTNTFGIGPAVLASAPGRVNLIGEHIDYNGGTVLPTAIPQKVEVALAANDTGTFRIVSATFEGVSERPMDDPAKGMWSDYAVGALAKAVEFGWIRGGVDLAIQSDVPDGAGLSSSAALLTAILRAAADFAGQTADPVELARAARAVENTYIGVPCGIMDQMAVGLATLGQALSLNTAEESYDLVDVPAGWTFVIIHSGVHRELSDGRYKVRFEECEQAAKALEAEYLCQLSPEQMIAINRLPENIAARARHVVSEHSRTLSAIEAMGEGDAEKFGKLMNTSHTSYAKDFAASTPEIDALVENARALGAKGSRLTGGGFGGCTVHFLVDKDIDEWAGALLALHPAAWRV